VSIHGQYGYTWDILDHLNQGDKTWTAVKIFDIPPLHPYGMMPILSSVFSRSILYTRLQIMPADSAALLPLLGFGALGILITYSFGRQLFGQTTAVLSIIILGLIPEYWVAMHTNIKDLPLTAFYITSLFAGYLWYQKPTYRRAILVGIILGFSVLNKN
jgi:4-amino-4-deoxy-L-arabinose transferase-like glycosyltransferase